MAELEYVFIDKSGHCFDDYASSVSTKEDEIDQIIKDQLSEKQNKEAEKGEALYRKMVAALLKTSQDGKRTFSVGDMLAFRDDLQDAGFKWGKDFYVNKKAVLNE